MRPQRPKLSVRILQRNKHDSTLPSNLPGNVATASTGTQLLPYLIDNACMWQVEQARLVSFNNINIL